MKKLFTILFLVSGMIKMAAAQAPNWIWAVGDSSSAYYENGFGISVDNADHLYLDGRSYGTVTWGGVTFTTGCGDNNPIMAEFDTSGRAVWIQSHNYSCNNDYTEGFFRDNYDNTYSTGIIGSSCCGMFIDKYDKNGNLKWAKPIGGNGTSPTGEGITADNAGNVYVTGTLGNGSVTMGSVTFSYSGSAQQAIFLIKLDSNGNCLWGKTVHGSGGGEGNDQGRDIIVDNKGYIYFLGDYNGSPTFDALTVPATTGNANFFLAKYDTAGNAIWVDAVTNAIATSFGGVNNITIDTCGNLYFAGTMQGTSQFISPAYGCVSLTSAGGTDMFLARCDNNGKWEYAVKGGSSGNDGVQSIAIDKNSDIYVGGNYASSNTINFGNGVSLSGGNVFVAKFSNGNGAVQWAQSASADGIFGLTVDKSKYVYVVGSTSGNGSVHAFGSHNVKCYSSQNLYIAKLDTIVARTIAPQLDSAYCLGSTANLPYIVTGTFNNGNVFMAQLSDSTGSFYHSTNIGSYTGTGNGNINITIPANVTPGHTYLIRVVSSSPAASSYYNGCGAYFVNNVYPNDFYVAIGGGSITAKVSNDTSICSGSFVQLHASGGSSYSWSPAVTLNDSTSANPYAAPTSPQIYTVIISSGSCGSDTAKVTVNVNQVATVNVSPANTTACLAAPVHLTATGATSYTWTPALGLSCVTCANPVATPTVSTTYSVTGNGGVCSNIFLDTITLANTALGGVVTAVRDTICQGTPGNLTLAGNSGGTIQWQASTDDINFTNVGDTLTNFKTNPLQQTTWYRTTVGTGNCSATSDTLQLYVPPALTAYFSEAQASANVLNFNSDSSAGNIRSYHWDFGDGNISTDKNPSHTYTKDTTYYVCLTLYDGSNCSYTFCRYSDVTDGVPTISAAGNWVIYPNPFSEQLNISAKQTNSHIQSIEMYDVLGQLVINKNLDNTTNNSLQLDVSSLAKGMYYVMIRTADADYVQKVVKQ